MLVVTQTLDRLGISYAVSGSLASSLHGVMRSTLDVDIVADMRHEHIAPIIAALGSEFYTDDEMMRKALEHCGCFNLIHYASAFKVDIFICKLRAFDQMQLKRRRPAIIASDPEQSVYVVSPEDIILAKLEWYRLGDEVSDRQWKDILGVLRICTHDLDISYMHHWASEIGVSDLLERVLKEAHAD